MSEQPCNLRLCYILQIWANLCFMEGLKEQDHENRMENR